MEQPRPENGERKLSIFEHFIFDKSTHKVEIVWEDGNPLFRAGDVAKVLGIVNCHTSTSGFGPHEKVCRTLQTAGGAQSVSMLTEDGFLRLVWKSNKPIARQFGRWMAVKIKEIQAQGICDLAAEEVSLQLKIQEAMHQTLLSTYHEKYTVYFGHIGDVDGKRLIKIGSTKDIRRSFTRRHVKDYGKIVLLNVFETDVHRQCEEFLLQHKFVRPLLYNEPVKLDGGKSIEVVLVDDNEYAKILRIARGHISRHPRYIDVQDNLKVLSQDMKDLKKALNMPNASDSSIPMLPPRKPLPQLPQEEEEVDVIVVQDKLFYVRDETQDVIVAREKVIVAQDVIVVQEQDHDEEERQVLVVKPNKPNKQTKTVKAKKRSIRTKGPGVCPTCAEPISNRAHCCASCYEANRPMKFVVTAEELRRLVQVEKIPFTRLGKKFGVSDNAVRKRCVKLGVEIPKRKKGYRSRK